MSTKLGDGVVEVSEGKKNKNNKNKKQSSNISINRLVLSDVVSIIIHARTRIEADTCLGINTWYIVIVGLSIAL